MTVDSSLELSTVCHTDTSIDKHVVNNRHLELSIVFYKELGLIRVGVGCWQAPWAAYCFWVNLSRFLNLFLIQIQFFFVFFSWETPCVYKEGFPLLLYPKIDWFNKIFLPFCPEDVDNLPNLVKSCVLVFFFFFGILVCAINDYFLVLLFSVTEIPTTYTLIQFKPSAVFIILQK